MGNTTTLSTSSVETLAKLKKSILHLLGLKAVLDRVDDIVANYREARTAIKHSYDIPEEDMDVYNRVSKTLADRQGAFKDFDANVLDKIKEFAAGPAWARIQDLNSKLPVSKQSKNYKARDWQIMFYNKPMSLSITGDDSETTRKVVKFFKDNKLDKYVTPREVRYIEYVFDTEAIAKDEKALKLIAETKIEGIQYKPAEANAVKSFKINTDN